MGSRPACEFPAAARDEQGCYPLAYFISATDCEFRTRECFTTQQADGRGLMMDDKDKPPPMLAALTPPEVPAAVPSVESVGVDDAIAQVKSLVPADTSPGLLIGGAALLAVLGAAFRFGPGVLKARAERAQQAHELELEKLRLEREREDKQDDQHKACAVERAALEAKVAALNARVEDLSAKAEKAGASSLKLGDFDPEALEERLAALEKKNKAPAKGRKKA